MTLFEGYERRIDKVNSVLAEYGIKDLAEAKRSVMKRDFHLMISLKRSSR